MPSFHGGPQHHGGVAALRRRRALRARFAAYQIGARIAVDEIAIGKAQARHRAARTFSGSEWRSCERSRSWDAYHNRLKDHEPFYPVFTTIRPRTCPARIFGATSNTSAKLISLIIWAIFCRSRSVSRRFHAS